MLDCELYISSLSSVSVDFSDSSVDSEDIILLSDDEKLLNNENSTSIVNSSHCDNYYNDNVSMNNITDPAENEDFSSQDLINYDPENIIEIKEVPGNGGKRKGSYKKFASFNKTKYPIFTVENFDEFRSGSESNDSSNFQCDVHIHYIKIEDI